MSPAAKGDQPDPVVKRLDAMLAVYVRSLYPESISDQIRALEGTGLLPGEIGRIVGRDGNYVSTILTRKLPKARKSKKA